MSELQLFFPVECGQGSFAKQYKYKIVVESSSDHLECFVLYNNVCVLHIPAHMKELMELKGVQSVEFGDVIRAEGINGKKKKGSMHIDIGHPICTIRYNDGTSITWKSPVCANALEINTNLLTQPELLVQSPDRLGYLAVLFTRKGLPELTDIDADGRIKVDLNKNLCYQFQKEGSCKRSRCIFLHTTS
jgi:hypothetical protein